jgi:hypothetical protein
MGGTCSAYGIYVKCIELEHTNRNPVERGHLVEWNCYKLENLTTNINRTMQQKIEVANNIQSMTKSMITSQI